MLLITTDPKVSGDVVCKSEPQVSQLTSAEQGKRLEVKILSYNIRRVTQILRAENIPIEAGLLFTP